MTNDCCTAATPTDNWDQPLPDWERDLLARQAEVDQLKHDLDLARRERQEATWNYGQIKAQFDGMKDDRDRACVAGRRAQREWDTMRIERDQASNALLQEQAAHKELHRILTDLRAELEATHAERDMARDECATLRSANGFLTAAANRLVKDLAEARAEVIRKGQERIVSAIFGHHPGAPRPFALHRREDVNGVSGTGVVALGAQFPDGKVVLQWLGEWSTVVVHDRGIESVEAIHGHDGKTRVVWLSDELGPLAEMSERLNQETADTTDRLVDQLRHDPGTLAHATTPIMNGIWPGLYGTIAPHQASQLARVALDSVADHLADVATKTRAACKAYPLQVATPRDHRV